MSLGLGILLTTAKKIGDIVSSLLSTLKDRVTYFENSDASKSTIKAIKSADVLDKATILLTPTATSDAKVHSVKTFTGDELMPSAATIVNVAGGSITQISNNSYSSTANGFTGSSLRPKFDFNTTSGGKYKLIITPTGTITGTLNFDFYDGSSYLFQNYDFTTTKEIEFTDNGTVFGGFDGTKTYSISSFTISLIDLSSDFVFDRASSATRINSSGLIQDMQSITDPELVLNGDYEELGDNGINYPSGVSTTSNFILDSTTNLYTYDKSSGSTGQINFTNAIAAEVGQTYKIVIDITISSGNALVALKSSNSQTTLFNFTDLSNGVNTLFSTVAGVNGNVGRFFVSNGSTDNNFTLNSISVQQVDPNDRWSFSNVGGSNGWRIADGRAICDTNAATANRNLTSSLSLDGSKDYKLTLDILQSADNITVLVGSTSLSTKLPTGENLGYEYYISSADHSGGALIFYAGSSDLQEIDNVSVKDITFGTDVDLARINYDSNGSNGHILLEPTSTNLQDYSENFNKWTHANGDFTLTNELAPDGKTKVYKSTVTNNGTSAHFYTGPPVLVVGEKYTASYFFKYVDHPWVRITHISSSSTGVWFNIQNGTIGSESGTSVGKIEDYGNSWYRCSNTFTATQTTSATNVFGAVSEDDGATNGVAGKSVLVWGAQVENLEYSTSYIPVHSTSNVTRATETLTGSGNSTLINSTEGVLYGEIAVLEGQTNINRYITINDSTDDNFVSVHFRNNTNNQIRAIVRVGNSNQCDITYNPSGSTSFAKFALKWKANDFALWVNGVEIGSDTSGSTFNADTLNNISFDSGQGADDFYGKCKALAVFNEALSDAQLTNLTS